MIKEEIENMKKELKNVSEEQHSLFWEMIADKNKANKRMFILNILELCIIVLMMISFFIYESQYETVDTETSTLEQIQEEVDNSTMSGVIN